MKYLLDTNTVIRYLNGRAPRVRVKIRATPLSDLAVSTVVVAELRYGAAKSANPARTIAVQDQFLGLVGAVPFDLQAAEAYGKIRAALEAQGTPIGANDMLIGATALAHGLVLVTHNTREFGRIAGLTFWGLGVGKCPSVWVCAASTLESPAVHEIGVLLCTLLIRCPPSARRCRPSP